MALMAAATPITCPEILITLAEVNNERFPSRDKFVLLTIFSQNVLHISIPRFQSKKPGLLCPAVDNPFPLIKTL